MDQCDSSASDEPDEVHHPWPYLASMFRIKAIDGTKIKGALYRIWCGVNRLGDSGVNRLGDTSAIVIPAGQLLLTRRGKTRMYTVGIVFEFYSAPLS